MKCTIFKLMVVANETCILIHKSINFFSKDYKSIIIKYLFNIFLYQGNFY